MLLEVKGLRKDYGKNTVLRSIDLEVEKGEVISVLGPSGSGKTTFLRCMTMLEDASGGSMRFNGMTAFEERDGKVVYAHKKELQKIHSMYGLVFQSFNLFPHRTVMQNIMDAPLRVQKRDRAQAEEEAKALLEKIGMTARANAYPDQLSGGQKQRVAIARALAMKPDMLFFDEPTSALDPELTAEVLKMIRSLAEEKMTMVIVTHEIPFARSVSSRVIFMDKGYVIEQGSPADVIDNPSNSRTREFLKKLEEE